MIERATGPMSRRTAVLALGAFALPWRAASADDQLVRLFAELGARRERHARFVERKFSALAKAPLESSGTLTFRAPNTLERHTIEPQRESVRIVGDTVTYEGTMRGSFQKRTFALA
ncbi:MAG: outer membrane lipoprotein carrier protein LolA, partial [Burkholderiaceae bacterium]|nr:outer membrane lipoprotein carrier protein LolA [Burkholderiaceae bacterium]